MALNLLDKFWLHRYIKRKDAVLRCILKTAEDCHDYNDSSCFVGNLSTRNTSFLDVSNPLHGTITTKAISNFYSKNNI